MRGLSIAALVLACASPARAVPLAGCRVSALSGGAPRQGDLLQSGEALMVPQGAALEIRCADGSLVRAAQGTRLRLLTGERLVQLLSGRVLVCADLMVDGVAVVARDIEIVPLGTTYLVQIHPGQGVEVTVLEGALEVRRAPQTGAPPERQIALPGETMLIAEDQPLPRPRPVWIGQVLLFESLLFAHAPLPAAGRMLDLFDQQRRGVLAGRNERLRRELRWRRPPRRPLMLPDLFR